MRECCDRPLISTAYIDADYATHEREDAHDWVDDGDLCCGSQVGMRHQQCYCGAGRWAPRQLTAELIADSALSPSRLLRWSADWAKRAAFHERMARTRTRRSSGA